MTHPARAKTARNAQPPSSGSIRAIRTGSQKETVEAAIARLSEVMTRDGRLGPREEQALIVKCLQRALRAERARGQCGHRGYDVARHATLATALRRAQAALAALIAKK